MANRYDPYRTSDSVPPRGFGGTDPYYPGANPFADGGRGYDDPLSAREREVAEARRAMWEEALRRDAERRAQALPRGPVADPRYEQRDRTRPIEYDGISPDRYEISQAGVPRLTDKQRAFQFEAQQALDAGEDRAAMDAIADKYGLSPFGPKLDEAISLRDQGKARAVLKPPEGEPFEPTYFNSLSDTPFGQYWRSTANGLANGYLDEGVGLGTSLWTGQPLGQAIEEADRAKQLGAGKFYKTNLAGELLGAATNEALIGRALAATKAAQKLGRAMPYAEDWISNALYGSGENNDDRVGGMAREGALGVAGGEAGRRILGGAGERLKKAPRLVSEKDLAARRVLNGAGMDNLTPGQNIGGAFKEAETDLARRTIVGARPRGGLNESVEGFNGAAFRDLAPEITAIGAKGIDQARSIRPRLYREALDGIELTVDPLFEKGIFDWAGEGRRVPGVRDELSAIVDTYILPNLDVSQPGPARLSTEGLMAIYDGLRREATQIPGRVSNPATIEAVEILNRHLSDLFARQAPDRLPKLAEAHRFQERADVLADAVNSANRQGGVFVPHQLDDAARNRSLSFVDKEAVVAGDRPFASLSEAGMQLLPSDYPLATRGSPGSIEGLLAPKTWLEPLAGAIAYQPSVRRFLNDMIVRQAPKLPELGDAISRNRIIGGRLGAPLLAQNGRDLWEYGIWPQIENYSPPIITNYVVEADR